MNYRLLVSAFIVCTTTINCGGELSEDTPNSSGNLTIEQSQFEMSSGFWTFSLKSNVLLPSPYQGYGFNSDTHYQTVTNYEMGYSSDCGYSYQKPLTKDEYSVNLSEVYLEANQSLEEVTKLKFHPQISYISDSGFLVTATDETGQSSYSYELKKISNNTTFSSGTASISGSGFSSDRSYLNNVCAYLNKVEAIGEEDDEITVAFGVPYEDTRLYIEIIANELELPPGEYDLKDNNDINILIYKLSPADSSDSIDPPKLISASNSDPLLAGTLTIERSSTSGIAGSFSYETTTKGEFSATFDIEYN